MYNEVQFSGKKKTMDKDNWSCAHHLGGFIFLGFVFAWGWLCFGS